VGDGSTVKPMMIVERLTMEADMRCVGYSSEKVDVCSQPNGYMTSQLFERWTDLIFVPYVEQVRIVLGTTKVQRFSFWTD
jgi:hypothetical protein